MLRYSGDTQRHNLLAKMEARLGHPLSWCYQCGNCSAGCPAAYTMSEPPNRIVRLLMLGQFERALAQDSYWVCSSCEMCSARCPRNVEVKEIMEVLRHEAFRRGLNSGEREITAFHRSFLATVALFGRLYEPGLIFLNNLMSRHPFKDITAAPAMLAKGKLKLKPPGGADKKALGRIFARSRTGVERDEI